MYNKAKNNNQFLQYGPKCEKCAFFVCYSGAICSQPMNNQIASILLPSYSRTYINLHIQYGINLKDVVGYRVIDEVSADVTVDKEM